MKTSEEIRNHFKKINRVFYVATVTGFFIFMLFMGIFLYGCKTEILLVDRITVRAGMGTGFALFLTGLIGQGMGKVLSKVVK